MKVTLEKDYRRFYTLDDLDRAKKVIAFEKNNDEETVKGWAEYAAREALRGTEYYYTTTEIIKAEARTAKNNRVFNAYGDDTENMDVWIDFVAEAYWGYVKGGAYLSDIWQSGAVEYKTEMYVRLYKEISE